MFKNSSPWLSECFWQTFITLYKWLCENVALLVTTYISVLTAKPTSVASFYLLFIYKKKKKKNTIKNSLDYSYVLVLCYINNCNFLSHVKLKIREIISLLVFHNVDYMYLIPINDVEINISICNFKWIC